MLHSVTLEIEVDSRDALDKFLSVQGSLAGAGFGLDQKPTDDVPFVRALRARVKDTVAKPLPANAVARLVENWVRVSGSIVGARVLDRDKVGDEVTALRAKVAQLEAELDSATAPAAAKTKAKGG